MRATDRSESLLQCRKRTAKTQRQSISRIGRIKKCGERVQHLFTPFFCTAFAHFLRSASVPLCCYHTSYHWFHIDTLSAIRSTASRSSYFLGPNQRWSISTMALFRHPGSLWHLYRHSHGWQMDPAGQMAPWLLAWWQALCHHTFWR